MQSIKKYNTWTKPTGFHKMNHSYMQVQANYSINILATTTNPTVAIATYVLSKDIMPSSYLNEQTVWVDIIIVTLYCASGSLVLTVIARFTSGYYKYKKKLQWYVYTDIDYSI